MQSDYFHALNVDDMRAAFASKSFPLVCSLDSFDITAISEMFQLVWNLGNTLFIIDETDTVLAQQQMVHLPKIMRKMFSQSRHRNIALTLAVRRPTEIPTTARAFVERLAIFNTKMKQDFDYLEAILSEPIDREKISSLPVGKFLIYPQGSPQ